MANKRNYTTGKTTRQLINIKPSTIRRLSDTNLRAVVQKIGRTVASRQRALERAGVYSAALTETGRIAIQGKTRNQLIGEYIRAREILTGETTVKQAKEIAGRFRKGVERISGEDINDSELYDAMRAFAEILRNNPSTTSREMRYKAYTAVAEQAGRGLSYDEIIERAQEDLDNYERIRREVVAEMSRFFTT